MGNNETKKNKKLDCWGRLKMFLVKSNWKDPLH